MHDLHAAMHDDTRTIENDRSVPLKVWLEPWATEYELQPGETLRVSGQSNQPGEFEIVEHDGGVAIFGWPGAAVTVHLPCGSVSDYPAWSEDALPSGMSIREFVDVMFGGPGGPPPSRKPWWKFW